MMKFKSFLLPGVIIIAFTASFLTGYFFDKTQNEVKINRLTEENKDLQKTLDNMREAINDTNKNDIEKYICIRNAESEAETEKCYVKNRDFYKNEISKTLSLLEKSMTKEQYKVIIDSQKHWKNGLKEEFKVTEHFRAKYPCNNNSCIKEAEKNYIVEERYRFLDWVYKIHTDYFFND